jgi:hypothetical protein
MKYIKKYLLVCLLTAVTVMSVPVKGNAFIGDLISIVKGIGDAIEKASRAIKWMDMTREVMSYPNEYIREFNAIMDEIESLKQIARQANLSAKDMSKFLALAQQYVKALQSSLNEFTGIVNMVEETFSIISSDAGDAINLEELFQRIKTTHKINMEALQGAKRIVNNTKALIGSYHAANKAVKASKQLK